MSGKHSKAIFGSFYHSPNGNIELLKDSLICLNEKGVITEIIEKQKVEEDVFQSKLALFKEQNILIETPSESCFLPGFIDLHVHAPQFPQMGTGLYLPLEVWLQKLTFPLESKYKDVELAKKVYNSLVDTLLSHGTTSVLYFSSIHADSTIELAKICLQKGQRAFVGKVCMDNKEECPEYYIETTEESINETKRVIQAIHKISDENYIQLYGNIDKNKNINDFRLVRPVITPRFIPSCTDELLQQLGQLASENTDVIVQSHCSESNWAVEYCANRFDGKSDTEIYKQFGLLRKNSVWAHSIYLSDNDLSLFKENKAGLAHCPLSNSYFANAAFQTKRIQNFGIHRIGLGTDISGGYSPSMYDSCRQAVVASLALEDGVNGNDKNRALKGSRIDMENAFYLATMGGALSLGIDHLVGSFELGKYFDAQLITIDSLPLFALPNLQLSEKQEIKQELERIMHSTTKQNIQKVWVSGREVYSNTKM